MKTHLAYFDDTYKFDDNAIILSSDKDEIGYYVVLNQTIYYPQGGGQPSDQGTIIVGDITISITKVKSTDNEVRHYTLQDCSDLVGKQCRSLINRELRLMHAKLHTAGHLISNVIENLYPSWNAFKGHHFPDQCYVEFGLKSGAAVDVSIELVGAEIAGMIEKDHLISMEEVSGSKLQALCPDVPYKIPSDQAMRIARIGNFPFQPCGGTHVKSLKELQGLEITKYKMKNNLLKIYYQIV